MRLDTHTIVRVTRRLVELRDRPPLFHERITPATISSRLDRVKSWLGYGGCLVVGEHLARHEMPAPGRKQWSRWREQSDAAPKECPADHVICPNCAHDFGATSQADQDRIKHLEAELRAATRRSSLKVVAWD